jgi:hypothetical protein
VLGVDLGDGSSYRPTPRVKKADQALKKIPVEGEAVPTKLNVVAVRDEVAAFFRRESIVVEDIANLGHELFGGADCNWTTNCWSNARMASLVAFVEASGGAALGDGADDTEGATAGGGGLAWNDIDIGGA